MAGQKQFSSGACYPLSNFPFCVDHHTFLYWLGAGGDRLILTLYLHKTETARGWGVDLFTNGTEVGDIDAILQSGKEDVIAFAGFYLLAFDGQGYFFHISSAPHPRPLPTGEKGRARQNKFYSSPPPTPSPIKGGGGRKGFISEQGLDQGATV